MVLQNALAVSGMIALLYFDHPWFAASMILLFLVPDNGRKCDCEKQHVKD